jgi:hypothetical protein
VAAQEFLARAVLRELINDANSTRGCLRTFLLTAFQHDLIDSQRRATRLKRGGHAIHLSIDSLKAEDLLRDVPSAETPERIFDRLWAMTCLDSAMESLETEYAQRNRRSLFQALRAFLDPEADGDYHSAAALTALAPNALRQAVFRLRQRFRALLRQTISDTLEHPTESLIEAELAALRAALET